MSADKQGRVIIERNSKRDIKMRDLYLDIEGQPEYNLLFGETLELDLPVGNHRIRATNRVFSRTVDFSLEEGATLRFTAANIPSRGILSLFMVFSGTVPYKVSLESKT